MAATPSFQPTQATTSRKQQKREKWLKEPVARVEGALKFISDQTREIVQNAKGQWVATHTPVYQTAVDLARAGKGAAVNKLALRILAHGK
jgi:glutathionylspermidine synthase